MSPENKASDQAAWSDKAADAIVDSVSKVRHKLTRPIKPFAKFFAYLPLFLAALGLVLALLIVGLFRAVDAYLPQATWLAYFIVGGGFCLIGFTIWLKRPRIN